MDVPRRHRRLPWTPPPTLGSEIASPRLRIRALGREEATAYDRLLDAHRDQLWPWVAGLTPLLGTPRDQRDEHQQVQDRRDQDGWDQSDREGLATGRLLGLFDRAEGVLLGGLSLQGLDPAVAAVEVGIWVAAPATRRGLATEALGHVISAALRPVGDGGWGLDKVHLRSPGANVAARSVAHALGLRRELRRRQHTWVEGVGVDDEYGWGVLADEWDVTAHAMRRAEPDPEVGVGPHPRPWPEDPRFDPFLLRDGDRRNVADRYRWWRHEAIVADLVARAHPFHVAIENWRHDSNIGTVVRNANAFGAAGVHIVGRRSWNRRGAMVTDRYLSVRHHEDAAALGAWAHEQDLDLIGIDNLPGSVSLHDHPPPRRCVLLMGQEGPGLSAGARDAVRQILHIPQFGSTRSINAGVASGIAMAAWVQAHAGAEDG